MPDPSPAKRIWPVTDPTANLRELLPLILGDTGSLDAQESPLRIAVYHANSFPWDEIFKTLLYRDYKVSVTKHKADLFIEAML